jgi:hypothetical protein
MLFQAADALELTGLTKSQLREWTGSGRREVLSPDVKPNGPGRHALFSWQTLLVLRLLLQIHTEFGAEIGVWARAARTLRNELGGLSFPSLWETSVHFPSTELARLIDDDGPRGKRQIGIVLPLSPHLAVLAGRLQSKPPEQMYLFPPMVVSK